MAPPRLYLTGHLAIEHGTTTVDERDLPGRQGRLAFAYLVLHRTAPVGRDALMDTLWGDDAPSEADTALHALVSKLRGTLKRAGLHDAAIDVRAGTLSLRLPGDTWVDVEAAANAIDEAEGGLRQGALAPAWGQANVAVAIGRRPFLAGEEAGWIDQRRQKLRGLLCRGLDVLAQVSVVNGEAALALQYAGEAVDVEPFRETGYQRLMRLHAEMGNRGEALRVFARLRELLRDELGTSPSPQTEAVYLQILTA